MTTTLMMLVLVGVLIFAVVVLTVLLVTIHRHRRDLRGAFGQQPDPGVTQGDPRRSPDRDLGESRRRPAGLQIRPLAPASRERYLRAWDGAQTRFLDTPVVALSEADALVTQLLRECGFPTEDRPASLQSLPVEYAPVLKDLRAGRAIEKANSSDRADTEQVRRGMLHFRSVFEALVEPATGAKAERPYAAELPRPSRRRS